MFWTVFGDQVAGSGAGAIETQRGDGRQRHQSSSKERQTPRRPNMAVCTHLDQIEVVTPSGNGCKECLELGDTWVHLRLCMCCGHVG